MPFINGFFYPDEVKIGQPPDLGGMIAKAMAMRQARQQAQMQQERDKMGMELDRMKLAGAIESQKKEKAMATSFGELAKAYQASQGAPSKLPDTTPNFAALYGSVPGMGSMGLPGMIPTTVGTQGMNKAMSIEDLQKQMLMKVAEMGNPKDQLDAIQALVPAQRGRSTEDQMMINRALADERRANAEYNRETKLMALKEAASLRDGSKEREYAFRRAQSEFVAATQFAIQANQFANTNANLPNTPIDIQNPDGTTGKYIVPRGQNNVAQPIMIPGGGAATAVPEPSGDMTPPYDEDIGNAGGMVNPNPTGGTVGVRGNRTPPPQVQSYDPATGKPMGMVDTAMPTVEPEGDMGTVSPVAPGLPPQFGAAPGLVPAQAPAKSGSAGGLDVRNERLRTNWLRSPGYQKTKLSMDSADKVVALADSIKRSAAAGEPVGIQQLMVLWNSIQTVDQSVVKEGEAAMFKAAQGIMVNLQNKLSEMNRDPSKVNMLAQSAIDEFVKVSVLMKNLSRQAQEKYRKEFNDTYQREVIPDVYGGQTKAFDSTGMKPFKRKGEKEQAGWYDEATKTMYGMTGEVMP